MPANAMKSRIERALKELKPLMGVGDWEHTVIIHDEQPADEKDLTYSEQSAADVDVLPNYFRFTLNIYPKFSERIDTRPYQFDLYLLHELAHVLLSQYDKLLDEYLGTNDTFLHEMISERTTEMIARAVTRARGIKMQ
jgi:hypothetical protein